MRMEHDIDHLGLLDDEAITLDAAALEIAALDHPDEPLGPYLATLEQIAKRVLAVGSEATSAADRASALAAVVAGEFGLTGDRDSYEHPDNTDLIRVIDRRRGLPVSLAIIYVAAARRLGWDADALNTPGHVLVRVGSPTEPVLIDPFNEGAVVGPPQLAALLAQMLGPRATPSADHLVPMSNRSVLVRLLTNAATRAEASGNRDRALTLFGRITTVSPSSALGWWERARLELASGDASAARGSLSALLEVTRDPDIRAQVFAALEAL